MIHNRPEIDSLIIQVAKLIKYNTSINDTIDLIIRNGYCESEAYNIYTASKLLLGYVNEGIK